MAVAAGSTQGSQGFGLRKTKPISTSGGRTCSLTNSCVSGVWTISAGLPTSGTKLLSTASGAEMKSQGWLKGLKQNRQQ
jgi:hypothetical protein